MQPAEGAKTSDCLIRNYIKLKSNTMPNKPGLYANIKAKQDRIAAGSGEKMKKPGSKGAPTKQDFVDAAKTAKKPKKK